MASELVDLRRRCERDLSALGGTLRFAPAAVVETMAARLADLVREVDALATAMESNTTPTRAQFTKTAPAASASASVRHEKKHPTGIDLADVDANASVPDIIRAILRRRPQGMATSELLVAIDSVRPGASGGAHSALNAMKTRDELEREGSFKHYTYRLKGGT